MARQIDTSKPLSKEDREWLASRNQHDTIAWFDNEHGADPASLPDSQHDDTRDALVALLGRHGIDAGSDPLAALDSHLSAAASATNDANGNGVDDEDEQHDPSQEEDEDYSTWSNDRLRAECERRDLSRSGNKADLVARLEADDEE